jgi:hypothetical protein
MHQSLPEEVESEGDAGAEEEEDEDEQEEADEQDGAELPEISDDDLPFPPQKVINGN